MDRWRPFIGNGSAVVATATPTVTATPTATPTPDLLEEIVDSDLGRWPKAVLQYKEIILSAAKTYRIEPKLFSALIYIESWLPYDKVRCPDGPCTGSCTSDSGAIGPAQVMPLLHFPEGINGRDPAINIPKGMEILREYIDLAGGEIGKGLAFYNCGPVGFETDPTPCWKYAGDVLHEYSSR